MRGGVGDYTQRVAVALANQTGRWLGPPLVVVEILAYGAAVTSLGLALATWVGRVSLALALCVGAVVGVTIGAIPVESAAAPSGANCVTRATTPASDSTRR